MDNVSLIARRSRTEISQKIVYPENVTGRQGVDGECRSDFGAAGCSSNTDRCAVLVYADRAFQQENSLGWRIANLTPSNYGHSIGHWEGDTLVVETVGLNEKFWMDRAGTPHTKQLKFTERVTRTDMNTLQYQATIDDPGAYTAPWTTPVFTMRYGPNSDPFEYLCQDNNHGPELMLGSQSEIDNTDILCSVKRGCE